MGALSRKEIFFALEMRTSLCQPFASAVVSIDNRPLNGPGPRLTIQPAEPAWKFGIEVSSVVRDRRAAGSWLHPHLRRPDPGNRWRSGGAVEVAVACVRVPEALVPASRGGDVGRAVVLRHEHIRPVAAVLWSLVIGLLAARCTAQLG